jgi:hypothetical protein
VAWRLMARPEHWPDWSPHVRGAWGLADRDGWVREGASGAARLLGVVPVPAKVVAVVEGRSWTWRVGPVDMEHRVEPDADGPGCTVAVTMQAPAPVEAALRVSYGPAVGLLMRNLARIARQA